MPLNPGLCADAPLGHLGIKNYAALGVSGAPKTYKTEQSPEYYNSKLLSNTPGWEIWRTPLMPSRPHAVSPG